MKSNADTAADLVERAERLSTLAEDLRDQAIELGKIAHRIGSEPQPSLDLRGVDANDMSAVSDLIARLDAEAG